MQPIKTDLSLNLQLKATSQERDMLIKISRCNCAADVEALLQEFFSMRQLAPDSKFIRLALASAQTLWESKQLLKGSHNEDWYRLHVYSYIFDKAFINDEEFETKRSECYSNITKFFPNEPDQRIDFILRNINDDSDLISTEEKPGRKGVKSDLEKGKAIQKMMLKKWLKEIGSIKLLNKLEAITCQWEGTKLTIFATRTLTPDYTITYKKGAFSMPKSFNHLAELSKLLLAVLSLRRLVLSNYKKMNLIMKEKQREELLLLDFEDEDSLCLRSDSTYDTVEYDVGDDNNCKMDSDLEAELLKKIEEIEIHTFVASVLNHLIKLSTLFVMNRRIVHNQIKPFHFRILVHLIQR
ncbi:hypothetical protein G6F56_002068 [Rhizopus delemar]|uniref:Uncharacterized protein n=1 Tax=Rhizopus stolonifer TaxID=4846 RepID=A0A367J410_RHIST|nr:hypothetical protein G6F56_002068 [Rhizopus delemar]RCH84694.1 hypothetical protein CU098_008157 [Rhizopus stolonifer]